MKKKYNIVYETTNLINGKNISEYTERLI
jgi:hypothetical protein